MSPSTNREPERDDADLQPELVGLHAGLEDPVHADGVGDQQADQDGPQHVFDVGDGPVVVLGQRVPPDLGVLAEQPDRDQQQHARHVVEQVGGW